MSEHSGNGGGATHIAKASGQLSLLSNRLSDILIVAGGGGGGLNRGDGTIPAKYKVSSANTTFFIADSYIDGYRPYTKTNNGEAIKFVYYDPNASRFYGPGLISTTREATYYSCYGVYFLESAHSAIIDGVTWYLSDPDLWVQYSDRYRSSWEDMVLHDTSYGAAWADHDFSSDVVRDVIIDILNQAKGMGFGSDGGGISGNRSLSGNQSSGYAFGQGGIGAGGGLYGGRTATLTAELNNGAGSGYIGNVLLSQKKMVGYNVPTSSASSTKTESVNAYSATAEENKAKTGNGYAKISFLHL